MIKGIIVGIVAIYASLSGLFFGPTVEPAAKYRAATTTVFYGKLMGEQSVASSTETLATSTESAREETTKDLIPVEPVKVHYESSAAEPLPSPTNVEPVIQCNGKAYFDRCPSGSFFWCPPSGGDAGCQAMDSLFCNGKWWAKCPDNSSFQCGASGDPVCTNNSSWQSSSSNDAPSLSAGNSTTNDELLDAIRANVQRQQENAQVMLESIKRISDKYRPQHDALHAQASEITRQMSELNKLCGGFCYMGENATEIRKLSVQLLENSNKSMALTSQESAELSALSGYSPSYYNSNTYGINVPLFAPTQSVVFINTPHDSYSMSITPDSMGGYYLQNSKGGSSYRITSGGGGMYYVSAY